MSVASDLALGALNGAVTLQNGGVVNHWQRV